MVVGFRGRIPEPCTMVPAGTWQVGPGRSDMLKFSWGSDQIQPTSGENVAQKWTKFCSLFCSFLGLVIYAATPHICNRGQQAVTIVTTSAWHNLKWMKLCRSRFGFRYKKENECWIRSGPGYSSLWLGWIRTEIRVPSCTFAGLALSSHFPS